MTNYSLISDETSATITVREGGKLYVANGDHPNFGTIVGLITTGEWSPEDVSLFDVSETVASHFDRLSERVTVAGGHVYFDGDVVNDTITTQIVRFLDEGLDDFKPLVSFMEKLAQNPSEHSRAQLFNWLTKHDFTLTPDGDIVGYKGVDSDGNGGFRSTRSGPAIVDGESINDYVPNAVGSIIEMPRSLVNHDPTQGCSSGLHVGNWRYARNFASNVLKVTVNPRDVVSVPTDSNDEKIRCCRYTVVEGPQDKAVASALDTSESVAKPTRPLRQRRKEFAAKRLPELRSLAQAQKLRVDGRRPSHCTKAELVEALARANK